MKYKFIDVDEKGSEQHLHTLDAVPLLGTTTVLGILAKPLTWWASGLAVMEMGVSDPKVLTKIKGKKATEEEAETMFGSISAKLEEIKGMDTEQYTKLLIKAYGAHASNLKDKAKKGTDLHAELERFVKHAIKVQLESKLLMSSIIRDCKGMFDFDAKIQPFLDWSEQNVKRFLFSEGHCYSQIHWLGGVADFGAELNDGSYVLGDFKSSKDAYQSQFWQAGAYDIQITENGVVDKDGNLIFKLDKPFDQYVIVPFGADPVVPVFSKYPLQECRDAFLACMQVYKLSEKYVG